VSNRFGRRLFDLFFRSYTEKVWGVPCSEIRAEWAAQRIRGLSLISVVRAALVGNRGDRIRSLIDEFSYPRLGPGQMWEAFAAGIERRGGELRLATPVERLDVEDDLVRAVVAGGERFRCRAVISSLPLGSLPALVESAPPEVVDAAAGLRYRDFLTVAVALEREPPFPDTWIYVHEPDVRVARIQSYGAWSPWMLPGPGVACLGLEYFCFAEDELWRTPDAELVALAVEELERLGLAQAADVSGGWVVRVPRAYPMYDASYAERVRTVRRWLESTVNLQQVGRNGLHRYNNSDHSMLTAIRAVENLLGGTGHDLWAVNPDGVYLEEGELEEHPYRRVPERTRT
jgi:protoporphyrinogen oxidase